MRTDEPTYLDSRYGRRRGNVVRHLLVSIEDRTMALVTTDMVLRYVKHHYQITQDDIRTMRPMIDRPVYKVETLKGVTYEIPEAWILAREGAM